MPRGIFALREWGRRIVGDSPVRGIGRRLIRSYTTRRGLPFEVRGRTVRFLPGSEPHLSSVASPIGSGALELDALQTRRFIEVLAPGGVVADAGAFRGTYSLLAASVVGAAGAVFAFEPIAPQVAFIRRNLAINRFESEVEIIPAAISDEVGTRDIYARADSSMSSFFESGIDQAQSEKYDRISVRTTSLDAFFAERGVWPTIVKIDIEGAEKEALRGARQTLAGASTVFIELHPHAWSDVDASFSEIVVALDAAGLSMRRVADGSRVTEPEYGPMICRRS